MPHTFVFFNTALFFSRGSELIYSVPMIFFSLRRPFHHGAGVNGHAKRDRDQGLHLEVAVLF